MILPCLFIASSFNRGRGVFTAEPLQADTTLEIAPVIVFPPEHRKLIDQTVLHDYIFEWNENTGDCCMALGYVPVYNHSYNSNCEYEMDLDAHTIRVRTVRAVEAREELFINYNGNWNDSRKVWFEVSG